MSVLFIIHNRKCIVHFQLQSRIV